MVTREASPAAAEQRLKNLASSFPRRGATSARMPKQYRRAICFFLNRGMASTEGRASKFMGRVGAELDVETGRKAAYLAALNGLAVRP